MCFPTNRQPAAPFNGSFDISLTSGGPTMQNVFRATVMTPGDYKSHLRSADRKALTTEQESTLKRWQRGAGRNTSTPGIFVQSHEWM